MITEPHQIFRTPVLFIIFNRPAHTRSVFEAIRNIKPPKLYIAADGPRKGHPEDKINCREARKVINEVDWDCSVKLLFRDENLNCGVAPSSAITWLFEHEEQGIILEDDCMPSESFFWFCQELLARYARDTRVMHIGGNNFLNGQKRSDNCSYYFSRCGHIWGWATWRRAWKYYDFNITLYEKLKQKGYFNDYFLNPVEKFYRLKKFDTIAANRGELNGWDYQWDFARYIQSGLAVVPSKNLVKNMGFGESATHTKNGNHRNAGMEASELEFPLKHPKLVMRDLASDKAYFSNFVKDTLLSRLSW